MSRPNPFDVKAIARRIDVDNRLPLRYYYRTADSLLRQADIYRSEKNVIDLYTILLRFSSLVSETIPFHRDYQILHKKERKLYREKLLAVLDELESLQPEFKRQTDELNIASAGFESYELNGLDSTPYFPGTSLWDSRSHDSSLTGPVAKQLHPEKQMTPYSWNQNNDYSQKMSVSFAIDKKFQKMSLTVPVPKQETLSRHSLLGQNGLRGQWQGPSGGTKISYPSQDDFTPAYDNLNQDNEKALASVKDGNFGLDASVMETILSLNDGRRSNPAEDSYPSHSTFERNEESLLGNIRQPNPPPVLAQVHPEVHHIPPSRVADPRPGPAKASKDEMRGSQAYQHLHIPVKLMQDFLRLAEQNTRKNLETCGILAGSLKNRVFHITNLIIPKQESTSDSCQTVNEEEIFEVQDKMSLFPLGWIHTHPTQTCFMSSVDLHTHYSYQIMLPEAVAIVMAPTDTSSPHGIFHLSDPGGVSVIRNCQQRGFHPHEEPSDGNPLYEHCSHVYMNPNSRFEVIDLR